MADDPRGLAPRRDIYQYVLPGLMVLVLGLSLFNGKTSGVALAAVYGFGSVGGRLVKQHRGAAKRDLQLLLVIFYAVFGLLALAVTVLHEEDRWHVALFGSVFSGAFAWFDWHSTAKRHREAARVG
ncbi:MAG TPA: hypothetical protein VMY88_12835 [Acidimicrobiales bacterium]|nr:hypothetical protein [Acidimicrobiales bacterium]